MEPQTIGLHQAQAQAVDKAAKTQTIAQGKGATDAKASPADPAQASDKTRIIGLQSGQAQATRVQGDQVVEAPPEAPIEAYTAKKIGLAALAGLCLPSLVLGLWVGLARLKRQ